MLWCSFFLPSYEKIMTLFMKTFLLWKPVFAISLVIALFLFLEMPPQKMTHSFLNEGTFLFFSDLFPVFALGCVYTVEQNALIPSCSLVLLLVPLVFFPNYPYYSHGNAWNECYYCFITMRFFFYMGWNTTLFLIHCLFCISSEGLYKLCE